MGTRAVVRLNGKFVCATHWDGDPDTLGEQLVKLKTKSLSNILPVVARHSIDVIHNDYVPEQPLKAKKNIYDTKKEKFVEGIQTTYFYNTEKEGLELAYKHIYKKPLPTGEKLKKELESGYSTTNSDGSIKLTMVITNQRQYGDFAEFIYDIKDGTVYVAKGQGEYSDTLNAEKEGKLKWKLISERKPIVITKPKGKKGWKQESVRHSLARKGIKTGRKKR